MCVQTHCSQSTGIPCVFGGFDDGSIVLWDCRQPSTELTSLKLFPDPGTGLENSVSVCDWLTHLLLYICSDVYVLRC